MARAAKKDLKATVEQGIVDILESKDEPSEGRMKALALGIKMCALNAKLEESEYGDFFTDGDAGSVPKRTDRKEPAGGKRTNGSGESAPEA